MRPGPVIGLVADRKRRRILAGRQHHRPDRQAVFAGEVQVALVVGRAAEDRAGAVVHQDEVGDPDRQAPGRIEGMDDLQAGVEAHLLGGLDLGLGGAALAAVGDEGGDRRVARGQPLGQRMVRGDGRRSSRRTGCRAGWCRPQRRFAAVGRRLGEVEGQLAGPASGRSSSPASAGPCPASGPGSSGRRAARRRSR